MKKCRSFVLIALMLFLFPGCAAQPAGPTPSAVLPALTPTPAPAQALPSSLPAPTGSPVLAPAEVSATLAAYFRQSYDLGYAEAAYADLTHDGQNELIVVELADELDTLIPVELSSVTDGSAFKAGFVRVFALVDGAVTPLYEREAHYAHAGWLQLYLFTDETGAYLFDYSPSVFQGYADYTYNLFSLDASGGAVVKESGALSFMVDPDGDGYAFKDADGKDVSASVAALETAARGYAENAVPLLVYFEGLDGAVLYDFLNRELYLHS